MEHNETKAMAFAQEATLGQPGSIKNVAEYLLAEGSGIGSQTMAQIAAHTYVSKPTLVRFAKKAGYAGWTAYRHDFLVAAREAERERTRLAEVDVNRPFEGGSSGKQVAEALARIQHFAADEIKRSVNPNELEQSARSIMDAQNVIFLGVMHNRYRGKIFSLDLALMGVRCQVPAPDEANPLAARLNEGDCVVVVSYSGDIRHQPLDLVPHLRKRNVTVVAITNSRQNSLSSLASHTLSFDAHEHLHEKIGTFYSGACTSIVLDLLQASCLALSYEPSNVKRQQILKEAGDHIPRDFSRL